MSLELVLTHKRFPTPSFRANERPLSGVLHHMTLLVDKVDERSIATSEATRIRTVTGMDSLKL